MGRDHVQLSRFLSLVLRHAPDRIGLTPDGAGWVDVADLMAKAAAAGRPFTRDDLETVVRDNDKQRFTLSDDGRRIRAAQGHSIAVDLDLDPVPPPPTLYHGTATRVLAVILAEGLTPQARRQVHLSAEMVTARVVGARHGVPVVLAVDAGRMQADGFAFYRADNGVWLTDHVPPGYLTRLG